MGRRLRGQVIKFWKQRICGDFCIARIPPYLGGEAMWTCAVCFVDFDGEEWWLNVSGDTITAEGDAGDGSRGSPPPSALLRLPPLMFWGGIVGQLQIKSQLMLGFKMGPFLVVLVSVMSHPSAYLDLWWIETFISLVPTRFVRSFKRAFVDDSIKTTIPAKLQFDQ